MTRPSFSPRPEHRAPVFGAIALVVGLGLSLLASPLAWAQAGSREPVVLNFVNADIEAVARTMATISGRNVVVDPRVKGTVSLSTDKAVPPPVALNQFSASSGTGLGNAPRD